MRWGALKMRDWKMRDWNYRHMRWTRRPQKNPEFISQGFRAENVLICVFHWSSTQSTVGLLQELKSLPMSLLDRFERSDRKLGSVGKGAKMWDGGRRVWHPENKQSAPVWKRLQAGWTCKHFGNLCWRRTFASTCRSPLYTFASTWYPAENSRPCFYDLHQSQTNTRTVTCPIDMLLTTISCR